MGVTVKTFTKRTGTTDKGKDYEDRVIALYAFILTSDDQVDQFRLTSKDKDCQGFDSVVLEVRDQKYAIKLQYTQSHKRQITMDNLVAPKKDFSLKKNFEHFQKLKNKEQTLILYTTRNLVMQHDQEMDWQEVAPFKVRLVTQQVCPEINLICKIAANVDCIYKFEVVHQNVFVSDAEQKRIVQYEKFFARFFLFTSQKNLEWMEEACSVPFRAQYCCDQQAFLYYMEFITRWNTRDGKKIVLDKRTVKLKVAECLLSPYMRQLSAQVRSVNSDILEEAVLSADLTLVEPPVDDTVCQIWSKLDHKCEDLLDKINQINKCYEIAPKYVHNFMELTPKERNKLLWYLNRCPLIVDLDDSNRARVAQAIKLCCWGPIRKKLVVIGSSFHYLDHHNQFRVLQDLQHFPIYEEIVDQFQVKWQGRFVVKLKDLVPQLRLAITTKELIGMVNVPLLVGDRPEPMIPLYLDRSLSKFIISSSYLRYFDKDVNLVVVSHSSRAHFQLNGFIRISVEHYLQTHRSWPNKRLVLCADEACSREIYHQICERNPNKTCHFFEALSTDYLRWITSNGTTREMRRFHQRKHHFVHETAIFRYFDQNLIVVCDNPGMGKSTLMDYIKNYYPGMSWVVKVQLREHYQFFQQQQQTVDAILGYLINIVITNKNLSQFDRQVLNICCKNKMMVVLWDGLDEVYTHCVYNILMAVDSLRAFGLVQWLTSRCHLKDMLQDKFDCFSTNLRPLDSSQQKTYIRRRLNSQRLPNLDNIVDKIVYNISVVKDNGFLGVPLQLSMLTDLFYHNPQVYDALLDNTLSVADIYHYFIEEKFDFYHRKAGCHVDNYLLAAILQENLEFLSPRYQQMAALSLCPGPSPSLAFSNNKTDTRDQMVDEIQQEGDPFGFVTHVDDHKIPVFSHKTFGEYFMALHLIKFTLDSDNLAQIIFDQYLINVRFFFDMLMAKDCQAHLAVLYRNFDYLTNHQEKIASRDRGGRSPLHLCCSWGQTHLPVNEMCCGSNTYSISRWQLRQVKEESCTFANIAQLLLIKCDYLEQDALFHWSAVEYADQSKSLALIEWILAQGYQVDITQLKMYNTCAFLYYAVRFNYEHIFNLVVDFPYIHLSEIYDGNLFLMALDFGRTHFVGRFLQVKQYRQTVDTETEDSFEMPCHLACRRGDLQALELLIEVGANLNATLSYNKQTPLHLAAAEGYLNLVELLLGHQVQVNVEDHSTNTPLHYAAANGHPEVVNLLLNHGATWDVNKKGQRIGSRTPLEMAAEEGHLDVVIILARNREKRDLSRALSRASANSHLDIIRFLIDKLSAEYGADRLLLSAQHGDVDTVAELSANIHDPKQLDQLLLVSAKGEKSEVVALLARRTDGARVDNLLRISVGGAGILAKTLVTSGLSINSSDALGNTLLHYATDINLVSYLIAQGAQVNTVNLIGNTPLHLAVIKDDVPLVRLLLDQHASVDLLNNKQESALTLACRNLHLEMVQLLITKGADIKLPTNKTALHESLESAANIKEFTDLLDSSRCSHNGIILLQTCPQLMDNYSHSQAWQETQILVQLLLDTGVSYDRPDSEGMRPLHLAASNGHFSFVKMLVDLGADVNALTPRQRTPLHCIVAKRRLNKQVVGYLHPKDAILPQNCLKILHLLLDNGAEVNVQEEDGHTPLHLAAATGDLEQVQILIENGGDLQIRNYYGWRPLEMAAVEVERDVEKYLAEVMGETYVAPNLQLVPYVRPYWIFLKRHSDRKYGVMNMPII